MREALSFGVRITFGMAAGDLPLRDVAESFCHASRVTDIGEMLSFGNGSMKGENWLIKTL